MNSYFAQSVTRRVGRYPKISLKNFSDSAKDKDRSQEPQVLDEGEKSGVCYLRNLNSDLMQIKYQGKFRLCRVEHKELDPTTTTNYAFASS